MLVGIRKRKPGVYVSDVIKIVETISSIYGRTEHIDRVQFDALSPDQTRAGPGQPNTHRALRFSSHFFSLQFLR